MRQCLLELTAQPWNSRVQHSQALIELAEQAIASNPNRATEDVIAHPVMAPPGEAAFYTRVVATCRPSGRVSGTRCRAGRPVTCTTAGERRGGAPDPSTWRVSLAVPPDSTSIERVFDTSGRPHLTPSDRGSDGLEQPAGAVGGSGAGVVGTPRGAQLTASRSGVPG
jgi:hypothetical protein